MHSLPFFLSLSLARIHAAAIVLFLVPGRFRGEFHSLSHCLLFRSTLFRADANGRSSYIMGHYQSMRTIVKQNFTFQNLWRPWYGAKFRRHKNPDTRFFPLSQRQSRDFGKISWRDISEQLDNVGRCNVIPRRARKTRKKRALCTLSHLYHVNRQFFPF